MTTANWSIRVRRGEIEVEVAGVTQKVLEPDELLEKVVKKYAPEWVKITHSSQTASENSITNQGLSPSPSLWIPIATFEAVTR